MREFGHLPFKWKLTLVLMATTVFSLLVACAAFFWYDNYLFRQSVIQGLQSDANSLSAISPAAILSRNTNSLNKALEALASKDIVAAAVYTRDDALLSEYKKDGGEVIPSKPSRLQYSFAGEHLVIFRPVAYEGVKVGTIYLKSDIGKQV
jgi:hypothetical protein